jgi:hypothetical protein
MRKKTSGGGCRTPCGVRRGTIDGVCPFRDVRTTSRCRARVAADPTDPRGVGLTFGAHSVRRIGSSGFPIPLRPFAGPWGFPPYRRPRPIARPTRLAPRAFAPPPGFSLEAACRASSFRAPRDAPLLGFRALQRMPDSRVHSPRGFQPPLRSGLRVSTLSPACSPRALPALFHAGALLGFALQGLAPPGPSAPLTRPVTPTTLAARRLRTSRRPESRQIGRATRQPVLGASRTRSPNRPTGCSPGAKRPAPLLGFILPEALPPPAAPPRLAAIPPWASRRPSSLRPAVAPALRGLVRRAA